MLGYCIIIMKYVIMTLLVLLATLLPMIHATGDGECFLILHSAELDLTDSQMNDACEDIAKTGEAYIEDFRDRGLLIKFITLGDTVAIPLSETGQS